MKFSNETLNKAIRDLIETAAGDYDSKPAILAIRAEQNAPIPDDRPFATVRLTLRPLKGWAERTLENNISGDDIDETIAERVMVRASINYFKNRGQYADGITISALDEASAFGTFLQGSSAIQSLDVAGIGINRISEVRNVTALDKTQWEERAQLDLDFNVVASRTDLICEIKSVLIQGEYQEHSNEYIRSFTVDETTCT